MPYASWPLRAAAFVIDVMLVTAVVAAVGLTGAAAQDSVAADLATLLVLVVLGANRWYLGGRTGQSLGRRLAGISLVYDRTHDPIGVLPAVVRDAAHVADSLALHIGWLFPLWDAKRQTLADKLIGTVVIKAAKPAVARA
ncbi:hypothetical protein Cs7R123_11680 [Catellatospora sp. TT07R-123]|uniref:RDD family protein n=1 Tax=Catellatospora sp. TT07R-123 TaxID=2733863 RepID=UPI001B084D43|nr:RDD family protein [Catellatospora sp. TT07R-123]GHJ43826.1 hypothetical protein Cs7R123_11680 [Catellatospora sp. TT07R-123]